MKPITSSTTHISYILLIVIVITVLLPACSGSDKDEIAIGEQMIEGGIRKTIISLANDIYSLSITDSADSSTVIMMAAYTLDPYKIPVVNDTNTVITDMFYCVFIILIFGHGAVVLLTQYRPEKLDGLDFVTVDFNGYHYAEYVSKMIQGILILALTHFSIELILDIEQWITIEMLQNIPGNIEPSPDNTLLYGMMSLIWLALMVFFILRSYVIILFASFAIGIGIMYIWGPTEAMAIMLFKYFIGMAFMQPIIVGVSCVVVRAIKEGTGFTGSGEFTWLLDDAADILYYLGLLVILFIIASVIVFGPVLQMVMKIVVRKAFF